MKVLFDGLEKRCQTFAQSTPQERRILMSCLSEAIGHNSNLLLKSLIHCYKEEAREVVLSTRGDKAPN
jgi:hypothetical protein